MPSGQKGLPRQGVAEGQVGEFEQLIVRAESIVEKIREVLPSYNSPLVARTQQMDSMNELDLRALVEALQNIRVELSIAAENSARRRFQLLSDVLVAFFVTMAFLVSGLLLFGALGLYTVAAIAVIGIWGSLGALISLAFRVRDADANALAKEAELSAARDWSLLLGPAFGAIGAILFILLVSSGLVTGEVLSTTHLRQSGMPRPNWLCHQSTKNLF